MQHVVLRRFHQAAGNFDEETRGTRWPSKQELTEILMSLPEYKALCDVGHPNGSAAEIQKDVENFAMQHIDRIQRKWLTNMLHKCMSIENLQKRLMFDCGGKLPDHYYDVDTLCRLYYLQLEQSITETLLADNEHEYDDHELEFMIPFVESPWFERERIKMAYKAERKV